MQEKMYFLMHRDDPVCMVSIPVTKEQLQLHRRFILHWLQSNGQNIGKYSDVRHRHNDAYSLIL